MNKNKKRSLVSLILVLVMLLSVVSIGFSSVVAVDVQLADTSSDTKTVYFSINGQWTQKLCAVYTWDDDYSSGEWFTMKNPDSTADLWSVEIPAGYDNIIFCSRTAPVHSWDTVKNQTGQLVIPEGCDHFTLTGETSGVWDSYMKDTESPIGTRIIYFAPNAEWMEIQSAQGHNFAVRAYDTTLDSVGSYYDMTLVEGSYGVYPTIWAAEISEAYTNVEFMRGEGTYEDGSWHYWESTLSTGIHPSYNLFTQDENTYQTGEWSYIDAPVPTEPEVTEPEATEPEQPTQPGGSEPEVDPVETKKVYFVPGSVWTSAISQSGAFSVCTWSASSETKTWTWLEAVADGSYCADIPATDSELFFAISYSTEPDAVWNQTENLTMPEDSNRFTQDVNDFTTGTWHTTGTSVAAYYVVFIDNDGVLIDAQLVKEGESATAPEAPVKSGYVFKGWDTDFSCVKTNLTVMAQYEVDSSAVTPVTTGNLKIEVPGGTGFTISVKGSATRPQGTSYVNTMAPIGADVTVVANAVEGREFMGWINPANGQVLSTDYSYSFVTSGNDFIKAMFKVDVEGVNAVIFKNTKANSGKGQILDMQYYAYGDEIVNPKAPSQAGFDFTGWSASEEDIQANLKENLDTNVIAVWKERKVYVPVEIVGGTGSGDDDGEGNYLANFALQLTADEAPEGKKFAYWTFNGKIKSYQKVCEVYPVNASKAEAVFVDEDAVIEYSVIVNMDTADTVTEPTKLRFYFSWEVLEEQMGVEYVKSGIVATNKKNYTGTNLVAGSQDTNVYDRGPSTKNPIYSFFWTKSNVAAGETWIARAYVQYKTADGTLHTVYSDLMEATK